MNPISATGSNGGNGQGNLFSSTKNVLGKDDFLKMLITQISFQDPLNPLKATEFSSQLAQFSSVEQLQNIQQTLKDSINTNLLLSSSINNTLAATVIGKEVKALGNEIFFNGQDAKKISFNLDGPAKDVKIEIVDANGDVKRTLIQSDLSKGDQQVEWDGKDADGNTLPKGKYQFRITASAADGSTVAVQSYMTGRISGVRYRPEGAVLILGDQEISLADVYEILEG